VQLLLVQRAMVQRNNFLAITTTNQQERFQEMPWFWQQCSGEQLQSQQQSFKNAL